MIWVAAELVLLILMGMVFAGLFVHLIEHQTRGTAYSYIRYGVSMAVAIGLGVVALEINHEYEQLFWLNLLEWVVLLGSMAGLTYWRGRVAKLW